VKSRRNSPFCRLYLQPIFDSEDIMRQLPAEGRRFASVDKLFRKTMQVGSVWRARSY